MSAAARRIRKLLDELDGPGSGDFTEVMIVGGLSATMRSAQIDYHLTVTRDEGEDETDFILRVRKRAAQEHARHVTYGGLGTDYLKVRPKRTDDADPDA